MSNQQSSTCNTICCFILMILFALISFSIRDHPKDLRVAEVNSLYQKNSSRQLHPDSALFNITTFPINSKYFQLLELLPLDKKDKHNDPCLLADRQNSLLLVNVNTRTVGLQYFQLIKTLVQYEHKSPLKNSQQSCLNFRIYLLKQKKFLFFDYESTLNEYAYQISKAVQLVASITANKMNVVSSEQGSALMMKSLLNLVKQGNFGPDMSKKLNNFIMINLYNRKTLFQRENVAKYLQKIKKSILEDRKILKVFNSLKLIMINMLREQYQLLTFLQSPSPIVQQGNQFFSRQNEFSERLSLQSKISESFFVFEKDKHFFFNYPPFVNHLQPNGSQSFNSTQFKEAFAKSDEKYLALQKSHILHTKQMFNVHVQFNDGDYFVYQPFLNLFSHFIIQSMNKQLSYKEIEYFFRYGQTNTKIPLQYTSEINYQKCPLYRLHFSEPTLWNSNESCFRIIVNASFERNAHIVYSDEGNFDAYSESLLRLSPHDNTLDKSLYLLEKINHELLIFNPKQHKVSLATAKVFSPAHPLSQIFSEFQILYKDQIDQKSLYEDRTTKKFPVKTCSNNFMVFPDDFPVGRYHRQSLLDNSNQQCYKESSSYWKFMEKMFDNESLCINLIIFILFVDFIKMKPIIDCMKVTFACTMILVWYTDLKASHVVMVLFMVAMIENGLKVMCKLSQCIQIERGKVFICMSMMFLGAWVCEKFLFEEYDYWKMVLIFVVFFINEENALVIGVKLYYLQDYIIHGEQDWMEIMQLAWFMRATQQGQGDKQKRQAMSGNIFAKIVLVLSLAFSLIFWPESGMFHTLITCYMKAKIFCSSLRKLS